MADKEYCLARVRVPRRLWLKIKAAAALEGKTLTEYVEEILERVVKDDERGK